ncbi:MAG: hypothetical protein RJA22_2808 [Verrucomicrobiota bacterium]|jgi:hypothetical protein
MRLHPSLFLAGLLAGVLPAQAAVRTGGAYSITLEGLSAGGGRSTSAALANEGTLGGLVQVATAPATVAKPGLAGQLYEATLQLAATGTNLNEGGTRQLLAFQRVDDGTTNAVLPSRVAWGVVSGPLAGINSSGLALATNVFQDTPAVVRGTLEGSAADLTLQVLNTGLDNWSTYAGDGIDDFWQVQYFGTGSTDADPARDPDGDGQGNLFEFTAGTNPTNAASRFELGIRNGPAAGQRQIVFRPRFPSRTYTLTYRTNAADAVPFATLGGTSTTDAGDERTVTDPNASDRNRVYRVRISYP